MVAMRGLIAGPAEDGEATFATGLPRCSRGQRGAPVHSWKQRRPRRGRIPLQIPWPSEGSRIASRIGQRDRETERQRDRETELALVPRWFRDKHRQHVYGRPNPLSRGKGLAQRPYPKPQNVDPDSLLPYCNPRLAPKPRRLWLRRCHTAPPAQQRRRQRHPSDVKGSRKAL